jgi:sterol desaturase/sphingolipid hydroxylase (fatty acid hydroxylase superfamily)
MLQAIWEGALAHDFFLFRSPLFFLLIAQATQFFGCCFFSLIDLNRHRVPFSAMKDTALMSVLGFAPFVAMWYFELLVVEQELPGQAPTVLGFVFQLVACGLAGDFLHYWTHRYLHFNPLLRNHVHRVHHEYEGSLYSWVGMQVHPLEVTMITLAIYTPLLLFAHPMVLWVFAFLATMNATFAHSGYEGGLASLGLPFALTSSDHQLHHDINATKNYGNILRIWDKMFATYGTNSKHPTISLWS